MDKEVIFWLVAVLCGAVWLFCAIRKANKMQYIEWVEELQDKY